MTPSLAKADSKVFTFESCHRRHGCGYTRSHHLSHRRFAEHTQDESADEETNTGIPHQVESRELVIAERTLRKDIIISREVSEAFRIGGIGASPFYWASPMQTCKHRHTWQKAVLITMTQLARAPRRASVNAALVRNICPSTNGAANLLL